MLPNIGYIYEMLQASVLWERIDLDISIPAQG